MFTSIMTEKRDIDGATAWRLIARAAERESKAKLLSNQAPERPVSKKSRWPWLVIGLVASYFSIHVIVAVVRAALR